MKYSWWLLILFLSFTFSLQAKTDHSIVYVHLGSALPTHAIESMKQARLQNPKTDIYVITTKKVGRKTKKTLDSIKANVVYSSKIPRSSEHKSFLKNTSFARHDKFWIYTTERLLYVYDFILQKNLKNVFHIESDVMVYDSFQSIMPAVTNIYPSIAIPFANDTAAICSIVYFKDHRAAQKLADCIARHAPEGVNDMRLPGILKEELGVGAIDHFPILPSAYVDDTDEELFTSKACPSVNDKYAFCKHFEKFSCIFDAVTIGFLLSVHDERVCEGTIFDPRNFSYQWIKNEKGHWTPYMIYKGKEYRLFNLHVHKKNLSDFSSKAKSPPTVWIHEGMRGHGYYIN